MSLVGRECYISYKGNPDTLKGNVVVRLDMPNIKKSNLSLGEGEITSRFITSTIPNGFEYAHSERVILYDVWQYRMKDVNNRLTIGR